MKHNVTDFHHVRTLPKKKICPARLGKTLIGQRVATHMQRTIIMYGIFTTSNKIKTYCVLVKYLNTFSVILKIREFSVGDANKISSNSHDAGTGQWEIWALEN